MMAMRARVLTGPLPRPAAATARTTGPARLREAAPATAAEASGPGVLESPPVSAARRASVACSTWAVMSVCSPESTHSRASTSWPGTGEACFTWSWAVETNRVVRTASSWGVICPLEMRFR